jgi:heat shock protein HtpX
MTSAYSQSAANVNKTWVLIILFTALTTGVCYAAGLAFNSPWLAGVGVAFALGQSAIGYWFGDKIALSSAGAVRATSEDSPQLFEMVQNLSKIAGIPTPAIYISPDSSANAFACGRDPEHASICFNQGILELLDRNEIEGVTAHELSHVKNRDTLVMTVVAVLASVLAFIADIGGRVAIFGGNRDNKSGPAGMIFFIVLMVFAPFAALLIQMAVSRSREFLADATAVTLTRYPTGLITALEKLYQSPVPSSHYSTATNHFFIAPPKQSFGQKISNIMSTHPTIEQRVNALKQM